MIRPPTAQRPTRANVLRDASAMLSQKVTIREAIEVRAWSFCSFLEPLQVENNKASLLDQNTINERLGFSNLTFSIVIAVVIAVVPADDMDGV